MRKGGEGNMLRNVSMIVALEQHRSKIWPRQRKMLLIS